LDTLSFSDPIYLQGIHHDSPVLIGLLKNPADIGIDNIQLGIADISGALLESQTIPFSSFIGAMYSNGDLMIVASRVVKEAVGYEDLGSINTPSRFWNLVFD